jgi:hypothetical protein
VAVVTDIADAVVTELNAHTFSQAFTAVRHYRPIFDLAEMQDLHVTVVPKGLAMQRADRTRHQVDYEIDVAIQQKVAVVDAATLDPLMGLVEEVIDYFRNARLAAVPEAVCMGVRNEPVYAPEHLDELRQFTSVLTLTFRVVR